MTITDTSRALAHCRDALRGMQVVRNLYGEGETAQADAFAKETVESIRQAVGVLAKDGARPLDTPPVDGIPLHLLDTPDARELLALLERAQIVAERLDASRGRVLPDTVPLQPGESRGTDLAEGVSLLAYRVRLDIEGPKGRE